MAEASAMFTCITCRVAFTDSEVQRAHYKTDWHRYNLKRKVAEMPPVTAENFQQRVLAQREKASAQEKNTSSHCHVCNKHFSTLNAFNNHLQSKKHRDLVSKEKHRIRVEENNRINKELTLANQKDAVNEALKNSMQAGIGQSEDQSASSHSKKSQSGKASLLVLAKDTDEEDMEADDSDAESWESFDGEGLGVEECLFCSYISQSLEENLGHMTTKHSFFIPDAEFVSDLEGLISYLGEKVGEGNVCLWCNERGRHFQSTQAVQRHMVDKGHCKIVHEGEAIFEYADFYDYRSSYPDFDPESTEGATGGAVVAVEDSGIEDSLLETDGYELVLPSGAVIGHRSLQRYFRQNIPARREGRTRSIMPKLLAQYKALGWTGIKGEAAVQKAKDLTAFRRIRDKHRMQVGVKANKLQHHFRPQVVF